ncbi:MAG: hypothetical protein K8L97_01620 [Anaerolineae bacterium]|nr:hypothetical protein [Anaerolineae bacterium]
MASQNPRAKPHMRRMQAVLNDRYKGEKEAIEFLDYARSQDGASDRAIITEALLMMRKKKMGKDFTLPNFRETVSLAPESMDEFEDRLTQAVTAALTKILSGLSLASPKVTVSQIQTIARESAVSTFNLVGKSMRYEPDEDE